MILYWLLCLLVWTAFGSVAYRVMPHNRVGAIEFYLVCALIALVYWRIR